jgi:hypothetical protein
VGGQGRSGWLARLVSEARLMRPFMYRCLNTGRNVQGFSAEYVSEDHHVYEPMKCPACRQIHHVNPTTGKVRGESARASQSRIRCDMRFHAFRVTQASWNTSANSAIRGLQHALIHASHGGCYEQSHL